MQQLHLVSSGRDLTDAIRGGHACSSTQKVALQFVSERWLARQCRTHDGCGRICGDAYGASGYVGALTHALGA